MEEQEQNNIFEILDNFKTAVTNGQIRLSLEYLVPVIDAIIDALTDGDSEQEVNAVDQQPNIITVDEPKVEIKEEPKPEKQKSPVKKTEVETKDITE